MDPAQDDTFERRQTIENESWEHLMARKYPNGKFLCRHCTHCESYKLLRMRMKCTACGYSEDRAASKKDKQFQCGRCGNNEAEQLTAPTILECKSCGRQTTVTANT